LLPAISALYPRWGLSVPVLPMLVDPAVPVALLPVPEFVFTPLPYIKPPDIPRRVLLVDAWVNERSRSLHQALLHRVPAIDAQSYRFAGPRGPHKRLHAVSPHKNSAAADVEEYTKVRDVMDHAFDRNEVVDVYARQGALIFPLSYPSLLGDGNRHLCTAASQPE